MQINFCCLEDAFTHEEATTRPKGGMPELDSVSEKFEMLTSSSKRSGHLSGRITMTDEDIDRKEVLSTSARRYWFRDRIYISNILFIEQKN